MTEKIKVMCKNIEACLANKKNAFKRNLIFVCLYRLLLDVLYVVIIHPKFGSMVTEFSYSGSLLPYVISWIAVAAFLPFVCNICNSELPSSLIVSFLNFSYFLPLTSYYGCKGTASTMFFFFGLLYWAVMLFVQYKLPVLELAPINLKKPDLTIQVLSFVIWGFVFYISWKFTGLRVSLDLYGVYSLRNEVASYEFSPLTSYVLSVAPVILSIIMCFWLNSKKWAMAGFNAIIFMLLFSIGGHKTIFFLFLLVIIANFLWKSWMTKILPALFVVLNITELLEYLLFNSYNLLDFLTRRVMFVPVALGEAYYSFFSSNPLNLFREGIIGRFYGSRIYTTTIPRIIGEYLGAYSLNANTGLLGDAFANLPTILGIVIMPLVLIICFRLMDMTSKGVDNKLIFPLAFYFGNAFANSSWSTTLLTHGFLLACFLLYLFPRKRDNM